MSNADGLTAEDMAAESATALPDKEVVSILDLNADLDLAIDAAAPIDLAVAANANVAAPIDAAVGANILSEGSSALALADQGVMINQDVNADATAESVQDSTIEQGDAGAAPTATDAASTGIDGAVAGTGAGTTSLDGVTDTGAQGLSARASGCAGRPGGPSRPRGESHVSARGRPTPTGHGRERGGTFGRGPVEPASAGPHKLLGVGRHVDRALAMREW